MPQLHTKAKDNTYTEILPWINTVIISISPTMTILMGGDLQATPTEKTIDRTTHRSTNSAKTPDYNI
jgi:hypothetical protein